MLSALIRLGIFLSIVMAFLLILLKSKVTSF